MSMYIHKRGWYLLEKKFGNKEDNETVGNLHSQLTNTHLHVLTSYKVYSKCKNRTLDQE